MKTLPKYFAIKNDGSKRFKKYIEWLNKKYGENWNGDLIHRYYGYDGYVSFHGTSWRGDLSNFANPVTVLTLDEWEEIINSPQFEVGEMIEVSNNLIDWKEKSFIAYGQGTFWCIEKYYPIPDSVIRWKYARKIPSKSTIEISVKVNGKEVSLKEISDETLLNIKKNS